MIRSIAAGALFVLSGTLFVSSSLAQGDPPTSDKLGVNPEKRADAALVSSASREERYRIGYLDTLEIQVFRHPDLTQRVSVNSNGTINLYRLDTPVSAVCKTERELADAIAEAYQKDYLRNPEVNVVAVEQRSRAFSIIGAVEKPGTYYISKKVSLLELLAQAGGPNKEAGSRLVVARMGSSTNCSLNEEVPEQAHSKTPEVADLFDFKIDDILEAKKQLILYPGDIVSVLDADIVYVYGNVKTQGQVKIIGTLTLTQAIASAEGLKSAARRDNIRVLRQKPDSLEREEFIYNIDDINKRRIADPYLQANDVVAVSEDGTKSILNGIGRSISNGIPGLFYRVP